jgi:dolichol-phosphate mannosyltransferase
MLTRVLSRPSSTLAVVALLSAWMCATTPAFSQEAYYWTYAQHPALSYFDHPPMVAWLIWLGTAVFGDGAVGLRLGTWLCGIGTAWLCMRQLAAFGLDLRAQCLGAALSIAVPILAMTHMLATPDAPLVFFWTLSTFCLWRARNGSVRWWLFAGAAAGAALLSKYSAAFLAIGGFITMLVDPAMRRQLLRPGVYLALVTSVIVFLPVIVWNVSNDFESFRFQTEERFSKSEFGAHWLIQVIAGQFFVFHPLLAVLLPFALPWLLRRWRLDPRVTWILAYGLPMPAYLVVTSVWIQVKINWLAPAFVPLTLGLVVWWNLSRPAWAASRAFRAARWSLLAVPLAMVLAPLIRFVPAGRGSSWVGWDEVARKAEYWEDATDTKDGIEGNVFFFAADYRDAAQLGRSLRRLWDEKGEHPKVPGQPESEPTLAQNVFGLRALQFDHWTSPKSRIGQDAVFVLPRAEQRDAMIAMASQHFDRIEKVDHVQVTYLWIVVFEADIYVCHNYHGPA